MIFHAVQAVITGLATAIVLGASTTPHEFPHAVSNGGSLLYALVGGAAVGAAALVLGLIKEARRGRQDTAKVIGEATEAAVNAARNMIKEYRIELENVRKDLGTTRQELTSARERIAVLEEQLRNASENRAVLEQQLEDAKAEFRQAQGKVTTLEARIAALEAITRGG